MRISLAAHLLLLQLASVVALPASADFEDAFTTPRQAAQANERTVGVQFERNELFSDLMEDVESSLELAAGLRIVPIVGKNHVQSVYDLLYLDSVDLALVRSDSIEYVRRVAGVAGAQRLTHNVARISNEKIVIVAGKAYADVHELQGQAIAFGLPGSGEFVTGTLLFASMGIEVKKVEAEGEQAFEKVRSGELAAMVHLLDSPGAFPAGADDLADSVNVLSLPRDDRLSKLYHFTTIDSNDLPGLVATGDESLPTYSVDVNLVAYAWNSQNERTHRMARFVEALVDRLDELQGNAFEPEWREVSLDTVTPNIESSPLVEQAIAEREAALEQWLEKRHARQTDTEVQALNIEQLFDNFNRLVANPTGDTVPADARAYTDEDMTQPVPPTVIPPRFGTDG